MIYLILDQETKRIVHISTAIQENDIGGVILDNGIHMAPGVGEIIGHSEELPKNIEPEKYFYINGEFLRNPAYPEEEEIAIPAQE